MRTKFILIRCDLYREHITLRRRLCHETAQTVVPLFPPDSAFVTIVEHQWKLLGRSVSMEDRHHRVFHRHNSNNSNNSNNSSSHHLRSRHMRNRNLVNNRNMVNYHNTSNINNISSRKSPVPSRKP